MKNSINTYIAIALLSFLVLTLIQFSLVYNTYELKNERYYYKEREAFLQVYSKFVMNDVIFEGGQRVFDSVLNGQLAPLRALYKTDRAQFNRAKQVVADSLFVALARQQTIGSLLSRFKKTKQIPDSLEYSLMIEQLDINIGDNIKVNLYNKELQAAADGIRIGGTLQQIDNQNMIAKLTIGSNSDMISKLIYSLHVEPVNRKQAIGSQMLATLALSVLSVFFVVSLFFITFRNWIRQKKLSEMKSDFINNITHEFHTPLSAIYVANKSLQNERFIEKKENIRPMTDVIQRQSERLQTLIGQVLDVATTNKMTLNKKEHAVNTLLADILLDYQLNITGKQVKMVFLEKAAADKIQLDAFHFTTMINNLLDNAVKYNDHKEKIVTVSTRTDKDHLKVTIRDNGIGMKAQTLKYIFEKFYRGNNDNTQSGKGLGLGLYYVQQCAAAHQWQVLVESEFGKGSAFTIVMPYQNLSV